MKTRDKTYKQWLIIILISFTLLAILNSFTTPVFRGPDEPAHAIYVRSLAHFRFPELAHEETRNILEYQSHEAHQPPLYYILAAGPFRLMEAVSGSEVAAARAARGVSILLGLLWIYLVSQLTAEFFGRGKKALFAAAFAAFIPMSAYISGVVNNDVMICLTFTWALLIAIRAIQKSSFTRRDALLLGLAVGLSVLSKAQGMLLLLSLTGAVIISFFLALAGYARKRQIQGPAAISKVLFLSFITASVICGWWFVRNYVVYGEPVLQSLYNPVIQTYQALEDPVGIVILLSPVTRALFQYFWAPFWVVDQFARVNPGFYLSVMYLYLAFWIAVSVAAMLGLLKRILRPRNVKPDQKELRIYALFVGLTVLVYISVAYQTLFVDRGVLQQGRLFLPLGGTIGIIAVQGFSELLAGARTRAFTATAVIAALVIMTLFFSFTVWYNYTYVEISRLFTSSPA